MKFAKLSFFLGMLCAATPSIASWERISHDDDSDEYIDLSTIRRKGNKVKVWGISNYSKPMPFGPYKTYRSTKIQWEYDCGNEMQRVFFIMGYTGPMGSGQNTGSEQNPRNWTPVAPETIGERLYHLVCGD